MILDTKMKRFGALEPSFSSHCSPSSPSHRRQERRLRFDFVSFRIRTFPSTKRRHEDMNREADIVSSSMSLIALSLASVEGSHEFKKYLSNFEFRISVPGLNKVSLWISWICFEPMSYLDSKTIWTRSRHLKKDLKLWNELIWSLLRWETTPSLAISTKRVTEKNPNEIISIIYVSCHPHSIMAICCGSMEYSIGIRSTRHGLWANERVFLASSSLCYNDKHICVIVILNTRHFWITRKTGSGRPIATREVYICRELVVWKKSLSGRKVGKRGNAVVFACYMGIGALKWLDGWGLVRTVYAVESFGWFWEKVKERV